ncbi:MAG: FAD-dependent monooxygenase [Rhodospirillaceae bacterium]|nr:FAD-dependent monooxygenase [Rhodospirillaceae bacterium]
MLPQHTEVLIVGAGPTGLALALSLQRAGVPHVLIDRLNRGENTSRAAVVHAHTIECLEKLGVSQTLIAQGLKVDRFAIRDRDQPLLDLDFSALPSPYPFLLMVPQDVTERVLAEKLAEAGGIVHRGITATAFQNHSDGVTATLATAHGVATVKAKYVVGADGFRSGVRQAAGIGFEGDAYPETFVLADVKMDWCMDQREVSLFFSPAGLVVVAPLPGGAYRIVATVTNAPAHITKADVQALIDERGPAYSRSLVHDVIWSSRFNIHHRLAETYRRERFFIMGDAAHVHSPAGGQGMNTGLVDAVVLGELLAGVLTGTRPEADLDAYGTLRRPAADIVLKMAGRLTSAATVRNTPQRIVRNSILSLANHMGFARNKLVMNLSGLSRKNLSVLPPAA